MNYRTLHYLQCRYGETLSKHYLCCVLQATTTIQEFCQCLHSYCLQCLHHEIEKSGSQQMFQCPICGRNTSIPVGGASVLPQNLHLGFEVEVAGYMSKMVNNSNVACDHCIDGGNGPAVTAPQHLVCRAVPSLHINHMQTSIIEVFICRRLHMNTSSAYG